MGTTCIYAVPATNLLFIKRVKESSSISTSKYNIVFDKKHVLSFV